jgi:hypothetical protein
MGGGLPRSGSTTHPTAAALDHMLKIAQCMRRHGISQFPDPSTTMPSMTGFTGVVSDRAGVILIFPSTIDMQSPAFTQAATACNFPLTNH